MPEKVVTVLRFRPAFPLLLAIFLPVCHRVSADAVGQTTYLYIVGDAGGAGTIEATVQAGTGRDVITGITGGDEVAARQMREQFDVALHAVDLTLKRLGLRSDLLQACDVHVHFSEIAIQKQGPSAGAAMGLAIFSAATGIPIRQEVALTGELTLRGAVVPVGGVAKKIQAALDTGHSDVLVPDDNLRDAIYVPPVDHPQPHVILVDTIDDVLLFGLGHAGPFADQYAKRSSTLGEAVARIASQRFEDAIELLQSPLLRQPADYYVESTLAECRRRLQELKSAQVTAAAAASLRAGNLTAAYEQLQGLDPDLSPPQARALRQQLAAALAAAAASDEKAGRNEQARTGYARASFLAPQRTDWLAASLRLSVGTADEPLAVPETYQRAGLLKDARDAYAKVRRAPAVAPRVSATCLLREAYIARSDDDPVAPRLYYLSLRALADALRSKLDDAARTAPPDLKTALLLAANRYAAAATSAQALSGRPDPTAITLQLLSRLDAGDAVAAASQGRRILRQQPDEGVTVATGLALAQSDGPMMAANTVRQVLSPISDVTSARLAIAMLYLATNRVNDAESALDQIGPEADRIDEARHLRSVIALIRGDTKTALAECLAAVELNPLNASALMTLSRIHLAMNEPLLAAAASKAAADAAPEDMYVGATAMVVLAAEDALGDARQIDARLKVTSSNVPVWALCAAFLAQASDQGGEAAAIRRRVERVDPSVRQLPDPLTVTAVLGYAASHRPLWWRPDPAADRYPAPLDLTRWLPLIPGVSYAPVPPPAPALSVPGSPSPAVRAFNPGTSVHIEAAHASLVELLKAIRARAGYFEIEDTVTGTISSHLVGETAGEVLQAFAHATGYRFAQRNGVYVFGKGD